MRHNITRIIEETIKQYTKSIISESTENKNMRAAKHYLYNNANMNEKKAMETIGAIKTDIPNSRLAKCKYMLALVRMFLNKELSDQTTIMQINQALKYAASGAHENEYDRNLNGMSAQDVIDKFKAFAEQEIEQDRQKLSQQQFNEEQSDYDIIKIYSFSESSQYEDYTTWCVTQDQQMWNSYTAGGERPFYFCLRKDFKTAKKEPTENCPLDNYGLSMIAVSVNPDGSPNTITCRWNHDNGANDTVMTPEQLSNVINRNFYNTFLPNTPEEIEEARKRVFKSIQSEIYDAIAYGGICEDFGFYGVSGTENMEGIEEHEDTKYERYVFESEEYGTYVLVDYEGEIVGDETFDWLTNEPLHDKKWALQILKGDKRNAIDLNGNLLSETWFDSMRRMTEVPLFIVTIGDLANVMDTEGNIMLKEWYNDVMTKPFGRWSVIVFKENEKMVINLKTGQPMFDKPVEKILPLGFVENSFTRMPKAVRLKDEYYKIYNCDGTLIAPWEIMNIGDTMHFMNENEPRYRYGIITYLKGMSEANPPLIMDDRFNLYEYVDAKHIQGCKYGVCYITKPYKKNPLRNYGLTDEYIRQYGID